MNNINPNEQAREEQQRPRTFQPGEHLIQLKSRDGAKDYLPVQWRLVWFRECCPHGTIDTEELEVDLDREVEEEAFAWNSEKRRSEKIIKRAKGYARYRAIVTDGQGGRATGTKSENAASFPDYIEKAETGAIGRALAALGFGTQFAPDLDEAHRIVDSPVEPQATNTSSTRPTSAKLEDNAATEQQLTSIRKLCEHLGREADEAEIQKLTYAEAKQLIQQLTAEYREAKQKPEQQPEKPAQQVAAPAKGKATEEMLAEAKRLYAVYIEGGTSGWNRMAASLNGNRVPKDDQLKDNPALVAQLFAHVQFLVEEKTASTPESKSA